MLQAQRGLLTFLAQVDDGQLTLTETLATKPRQAVALVSAQGVEAYLPLAGLVDLEQERARLHKALAEAERQIQHAEKMLTNENFVSKAPARATGTPQPAGSAAAGAGGVGATHPQTATWCQRGCYQMPSRCWGSVPAGMRRRYPIPTDMYAQPSA